MNRVLSVLGIAILCGLASCSSSKKTSSAPASGQAAKKEGIQLTAGQKVNVTAVTTTDADMSMGMNMKNSNTTTSVFQVISVDDSSYKISNTVTKMKMSMDMMGQSTTYDSEKPEDANSDMGKAVADKINKTDTFSLHRTKGTTKRLSKLTGDPEADNPLMGIMEAFGGGSDSDPSLESGFYVLPSGKKVGDTWADSTIVKTMKTVKHYKLLSLDNNIATVEVKGTTSGTGDMDLKGTSMSFTMDAKSKGQMVVDVETSRVRNVTNDADVNMNMEVMGQTMPVTSKTNSTITYQYQ